MELKGFMGGFYRLLEWVMRLSVINVLWVVFSFPVFLFGLTVLISMQSNEEAVTPLLFLMVIMMPFLLFPSTTAMFSVVRKWIMGDIDVPLFKTFLKGYKENYVQSMLGGLLFLLFGALMYANFWFYANQESNLSLLSYLFITLSVILSGAIVHFFSILVHFHMKFWQLIKNALLVTVSHPFTSISIIIVNGTIIYISLVWLTFLIPFFMGTLMAVFSFWSFHRIYHRMQVKQAELQAKEENEKTVEAEEGGTDSK